MLWGCAGQPSVVPERVPALPTPLRLVEMPVEQQPTAIPTLIVDEPLFDVSLDLRSGPVEVPLELQIPTLNVIAPVQGVGLTSENVMDSPKGPIGGAIWHTAFWYRGGGIPGEVGTATFAGHVNDPLGVPEIFAHIEDLRPGDLIIIHNTKTNTGIHYVVDFIETYSLLQIADPEILTQIYGAGPVAGTGPQAAPDGLSHITLITCAGDIVNGAFDHATVVYATRSE
jgi:hypothetical protein